MDEVSSGSTCDNAERIAQKVMARKYDGMSEESEARILSRAYLGLKALIPPPQTFHYTQPQPEFGCSALEKDAVASELRAIATAILRRDGDRDEDCKSDLDVEATCALAKRLRQIANILTPQFADGKELAADTGYDPSRDM